jgi:hypothetical protein
VAPLSPIHLPREKMKFRASATFRATVCLDGVVVPTEEVVLKVKTR